MWEQVPWGNTPLELCLFPHVMHDLTVNTMYFGEFQLVEVIHEYDI